MCDRRLKKVCITCNIQNNLVCLQLQSGSINQVQLSKVRRSIVVQALWL